MNLTLSHILLDTPEAGPGTVITSQCTCFCTLRCACGRMNLQDPTDPITFPEIKLLRAL
jgi:hypothetical protein